MNTLFRFFLVLFMISGPRTMLADRWPAYRGGNGEGITTELIATSWPTQGLKLVWRVPIPGGFSSFAIAEGKTYTVVTRDIEGVRSEVCIALGARDGKELWATPTGIAKYQGGADSGAPGNQGGDGPRSTPTWNDGKVYVYSIDMVLLCLNGSTGAQIWKKDIIKECAGRPISWQSAASPVIDENRVFVQGGGPGQSFLALNKDTGEVLWKVGDELSTHATPIALTLHGTKQVLFMTQSGLVSLETNSGKELWRFAFPYRTATACLPVVAGDVIFCTAGYDIGAAACRITKGTSGFEVQQLWRAKGNNPAASLWSPPVHKDGFLYGMIGFKKYGTGALKCLELASGAVKWQQEGFGAGNVVLAGENLVCLADDGRLVLVKASPLNYQEIAQFKAIDGKCWSYPAISEGKVYLRSTKEAACYEISPP
jgi:outer membrane protein assembly factor BamB